MSLACCGICMSGSLVSARVIEPTSKWEGQQAGEEGGIDPRKVRNVFDSIRHLPAVPPTMSDPKSSGPADSGIVLVPEEELERIGRASMRTLTKARVPIEDSSSLKDTAATEMGAAAGAREELHETTPTLTSHPTDTLQETVASNETIIHKATLSIVVEDRGEGASATLSVDKINPVTVEEIRPEEEALKVKYRFGSKAEVTQILYNGLSADDLIEKMQGYAEDFRKFILSYCNREEQIKRLLTPLLYVSSFTKYYRYCDLQLYFSIWLKHRHLCFSLLNLYLYPQEMLNFALFLQLQIVHPSRDIIKALLDAGADPNLDWSTYMREYTSGIGVMDCLVAKMKDPLCYFNYSADLLLIIKDLARYGLKMTNEQQDAIASYYKFQRDSMEEIKDALIERSKYYSESVRPCRYKDTCKDEDTDGQEPDYMTDFAEKYSVKIHDGFYVPSFERFFPIYRSLDLKNPEKKDIVSGLKAPACLLVSKRMRLIKCDFATAYKKGCWTYFAPSHSPNVIAKEVGLAILLLMKVRAQESLYIVFDTGEAFVKHLLELSIAKASST